MCQEKEKTGQLRYLKTVISEQVCEKVLMENLGLLLSVLFILSMKLTSIRFCFIIAYVDKLHSTPIFAFLMGVLDEKIPIKD